MLFALALAPAEKALNALLKLDPETQKHLNLLTGKVIAFEIPIFNSKIYWLFTKDNIHLLDQYQGTVDVTLKGSLLAFLRLSKNHSSAGLFENDITMFGDTQVAQDFKALFANLNIDWEEQLSHLTGDVIAHQVGTLAREISQWAKQSSQTLQQDLTEYIQEEVRLLPPREELQEFFTGVDKIRNDVERLESQINFLEKKTAILTTEKKSKKDHNTGIKH